ncbi:MAG: 2-oxoglutarate dehydrogenase E1 component, partial [Actinomycetota bacterium]|nr:2-oxoglutarate dehydrogenase E1 component [Actinomycetota bacterium]
LLYPFPKEQVRAVLDGYPNLREIVWVQEEPRNMGAWFFMEPLLRDLVDGELPVRYVGKPARPSPAQGSAGFHKKEHTEMVRAAFKDADEDTSKDGVEHVQEAAPLGDGGSA